MKKIIFAVAIACGCAQFAHAEQNQNWFTGGVQNSTPTETNGAWTAPTDGWITTNATDFALMLDHSNTLDFTPVESAAPDTNVMTRVVADLKFTAQKGDLPAFSSDAPKTAIMVKKDGTQLKYYAYANGSWVALDGDPSANAVTVLVEVDYRTSTPRARYGIISNAGATTTTNFLNVAGTSDAWLTLTGTSPDLIEKVSFGGEGEVATIRGDVQLGLFQVAGVKYGTSAEAVGVANQGATAADKVVKVLRDNNETITIGADQAVIVDTNGKTCSGGVVNNNTEVKVPVAVPETEVVKGNGEIEIKTTVTGAGGYTVVTPDTSKEIVAGSVKQEDGKTYATVATRNSVIENKLTVAGTTLTVNDTLKSYLTTYGGKTEGTYAGPHSSDSTIQGQLSTTPEGATRTMGQSYALGLAPTEAIVLQPAGADADPDNVKLAMPNVDVNDDFTVTYQVQKHNGTTWVNDGEETDTPQIPVGSGRFRVNTVIAPAN